MNYPSRSFIISSSLQQHTGSMYDIFLSYSTQDRLRLMPLVSALEQQGWTVFWDHLSIQIGEDWRDKIEQAVSSCRCVVVVWSEDSVTSRWVREEATEGLGRNVLLPIRVDNVNPPFGFRSLQAGNFIGWNGGADYFEFVRLANQIRALVGEKATPSASPTVSVAPIILTPAKPEWASTAGEDQYGRYADLSVKGVIQRFRRIEPGTFLMGSPPSEPGRSDNEIQHKVTLTKAFWLADTACTQALWQVVMGVNPASFKDNANNPVETVSWDDAQGFIQKLNSLMAGLNLRLPTEAEWEYACRAGTDSAFSFGGKDDLSLEKVNYSGTWDKWSGEGKTKPVKSYPPNRWGLYEMHGNVWEWCQDAWQEKLPAEPVTDPKGAGGDTGAKRVIRGGAWFYGGRDCRSAIRDWNQPVDRGNGLGLRLSLGH